MIQVDEPQEHRTSHELEVMLRMQPILLRRLEDAARNQGVPLETLITTTLLQALDEPQGPPPPPVPSRETESLLKATLVAITAAIALGVILVIVALALGW